MKKKTETFYISPSYKKKTSNIFIDSYAITIVMISIVLLWCYTTDKFQCGLNPDKCVCEEWKYRCSEGFELVTTVEDFGDSIYNLTISYGLECCDNNKCYSPIDNECISYRKLTEQELEAIPIKIDLENEKCVEHNDNYINKAVMLYCSHYAEFCNKETNSICHKYNCCTKKEPKTECEKGNKDYIEQRVIDCKNIKSINQTYKQCGNIGIIYDGKYWDSPSCKGDSYNVTTQECEELEYEITCREKTEAEKLMDKDCNWLFRQMIGYCDCNDLFLTGDKDSCIQLCDNLMETFKLKECEIGDD